MELSIREAKARFAQAAAAAARGERVVVTKHGRPFVELVSAQRAFGMDFDKAATIRRALGLDGLTVSLPPNFDDPAFSRQVLGLDR
jgi:prevent-host-death family protein